MVFYIPPHNYGVVEEDLFRSGQPNELNFPFLERLSLKTVIFLAPDEPAPAFLNFVQEHGIELIHLGRERTKVPWQLISEEVVLRALEVIMSPSNYPLHIMCHLGRHRTGTVVGCLRKVQQWNLTSIFEEYRRYAGTKVRLQNEQFIELFDTDLVRVPPAQQKPQWL
jgi:tyrosine-protein phosphatase OCA1